MEVTIMILLILLIFTLLATGLGFGLLYLAYLSRPTVYRFYWPSDSAEENNIIFSGCFRTTKISSVLRLVVASNWYALSFMLASNIKLFIVELPLNIKGFWFSFFPRGPSLLLTSPSGRDLPVPISAPPKKHGFIVIPEPWFLHAFWTARETEAPPRDKSEIQTSITPVLDAVADSIVPLVNSSSDFLPVLDAPSPVSHQWSSSCSLNVERSPVWLATESSPTELPDSITSAVTELPLPVQMAATVISPASANRPWSWPATQVSNVTGDSQKSRNTGRPWSLPGAENLTPTLRESKTKEEILADAHQRMSALMFDATMRYAGKKVLADSHSRMSALMEKTARRDAVKNDAGLFTPPATPAMDDLDLEANWGQVAEDRPALQFNTIKTTSATFPSLSTGVGNFIIGEDDESEDDDPGFSTSVGFRGMKVEGARYDVEQRVLNYGGIGSTLLSSKISGLASKNVKPVEALKQVEVIVAPEVDQNAYECWTPEAAIQSSEEKGKKRGHREHSVFGLFDIYTPLPERKVRAKLFRDAKRGSSVGVPA